MAFAHPLERREFTGFAAVVVVATGLAIMFVGAVLPTPLYPLYQQRFGFSNVVLTLIYAVYVLGNLVALLIFGRLSDQVGRRNATLPAIGFGVISTILFLFAESTGWLFAARLVSGFATGLASGTATAWISELPASGGKSGTGRIASTANFIGLAAGPLAAGLLASFAPWPLHLPYVIYLLVLLTIGAAIIFTTETVDDPIRHIRDLSLTPRLGVPPKIRMQLVSPAITGFVVFALLGFYAALIPNLLADSLQQKSPAVSGSTVFELFAVAAVSVNLTGRLASGTAMLSGLALLPPSLWLLVAAELTHSMPLLLCATALGGVSAALGYRGSLEEANRIAPSDQRSEVVSSYLIAVYAGNSVPVIGIGLLAAITSSTTAHVSFAAIITVLASIALLVGIKAPPAEN
ncbi:MAG: MFS transporter [Alphaproteobacteria bacterium]|nr:MFS transporter [Alphaproteobacteria bacterium]